MKPKIAVTGGEGLVAHYWKVFEKYTSYRFELFDALPVSSEVKKLPLGDSEEFLKRIVEISKKYNYVILAVDEEIWNISLNEPSLVYKKFLNPLGKKTLKFVDKYLLTKELKKSGLKTPKSFLPSQISKPLKGKWIVKKRFGRGGKGLQVIENFKCFAKKRLNNTYVVQEYIEGKHISFDILISPNDFFPLPKKGSGRMGHFDRILKIFPNLSFDNYLKPIVDKLRKISRTKKFIINIDAIRTYSNLYIIEINPRPSMYFPFIFSSHPLLIEIFKNFLRKGKIDKNLKREVGKLEPFEVHTKLTFLKRSL